MNYQLLNFKHKPSIHQQAIYDAIINTNSHINIEATAGSGKTTTLLDCLQLIPKFKKSIFTSFSNQIVDELKTKVPTHVKATTLHSLGANYLYKFYPGIKMYTNKYFQKALALKHQRTKEVFKGAFQVQEICQFARITMTPLDFDSLEEMCLNYDLFYFDEYLETTIKLIKEDKKPTNMDFADMIYLPAMNEKIIQEKYHIVCLDEAQDSNRAQIQFVRNLLHEKGRLISVGDPNQAIYSFAGADIESFNTFKEYPNTISLPLSVSYRCAKRIVEEAKKIYPVIEATPIAHQGEVGEAQIEEIEEGDMVLCRNNAPLLHLYFNLIDRGIKAHIIGKEIEKGILNLYESFKSPTISKFTDKLYERLNSIEDGLREKRVSKPKLHPKYIQFEDKITLIELILHKCKTLKEFMPMVTEIFSESTRGVKLLTIHKSKGLESETVHFLNKYNGKELCPSNKAVSDREKIQEQNLLFVAITRAKREFFYLNDFY